MHGAKLKNNKGTRRSVVGAQTDEEREREETFKQELRTLFPEVQEVSLVYSSIKLKMDPIPANWLREGTFGYFMKESALLDGEPISIAWLPHVKDMPLTYIEYIVDKINQSLKQEGWGC